MRVVCDYCGGDAKLVTGATIYPRRRELHGLYLWFCAGCRAWVGCHEDSPSHTPLGRLANAELREVRGGAHALFDTLWKSGTMARQDAYAWLAVQLQMPVDRCHIGLMDVDDCNRVMDVMLARPDINALLGR